MLVFEGLDTFATVFLNGTEILKSENMFLPHRVDITNLGILKPVGGDNKLEIVFESAVKRGREAVKAHEEHEWGCWNGETSRLAVRKAQYHWVCELPIYPRTLYTPNIYIPSLG